MNNIDLLTSEIEREPFNTIVAAMLIDELMEARDMLRTEADIHVARVQAVAMAAARLRQAAHIYASNKRVKRELHAVVRAMIDTSAASRFDLIIIGGESEPVGTLHIKTAGSYYWASLIVTVGADWLLNCDWFRSR